MVTRHAFDRESLAECLKTGIHVTQMLVALFR